MRKILIIGAGQSGLQLALSLLADGYDVTIMSARTPEEIRYGRVMSTQVMHGPTLRLERELGLDLLISPLVLRLLLTEEPVDDAYLTRLTAVIASGLSAALPGPQLAPPDRGRRPGNGQPGQVLVPAGMMRPRASPNPIRVPSAAGAVAVRTTSSPSRK